MRFLGNRLKPLESLLEALCERRNGAGSWKMDVHEPALAGGNRSDVPARPYIPMI